MPRTDFEHAAKAVILKHGFEPDGALRNASQEEIVPNLRRVEGLTAANQTGRLRESIGVTEVNFGKNFSTVRFPTFSRRSKIVIEDWRRHYTLLLEKLSMLDISRSTRADRQRSRLDRP